MMKQGLVRIGIDVGGTFTKAVAVNCDNYEIIGKYEVLTTHSAKEGVARGVIAAFQGIMKNANIHSDSISFIAHSTTQATNALLEGDVAKVGIVGMGKGVDCLKAWLDTQVGDITLAPDRKLKTYHVRERSDAFDKNKALRAVKKLKDKGAQVIVASECFSVDEPENELAVIDAAHEMGLPATGGHEITKLYGLKVRTQTAVINASIIPRMLETADMTESSVRTAGIKSPIMIMRGDGGLMNIDQMRKRPIYAMLSGPAASVAGCLMYLHVTDGIYFEVGGTSTNIGIIQNGRPMIKYVKLGGHSTFIPSLDVRVLGIAGGSMPRVRGDKIVDIGPRSAHIAGLPYSAFTAANEIVDPKVVLVQPKLGDPNDYVAIQLKDGKRIAVTTTCAANSLGLTKPGDYAHGKHESARKAISALAEYLGKGMEETAREILTVATDKIIPSVNELIEEYELDRKTVWLVGGGGGAVALMPFLGQRLNISYKISDNAEVISSIGVALAMVRDMVERTIVNPTTKDILHIRREAEEAAIESGAAPESIQVVVEVDGQKKRVRAIAQGTIDMCVVDLSRKVSSEEMRDVAAHSMHVPLTDVKKVAETNLLDVYQADVRSRGFLGFIKGASSSLRIVDNRGIVRLAISNGACVLTKVETLNQELKNTINRYSDYTEVGQIVPWTFVLLGGRILDYSKLQTLDQILSMLSVDVLGTNPGDSAVIVCRL